MKATYFGKMIRKLRIDKGIIMGEMAKNLDVSSAYLSAVETGRKKITQEIIQKVSDYFNLDKKGIEKLEKAAEDSPVSVKIGLKDTLSQDRALVAQFAREFQDLSPELKESIKNLLGGDK